MKLNKNEQNYLLTILFKSYILQSVICSGIILVCTVSLDMGLTWVLDRYVEHYYLIYRGLYVYMVGLILWVVCILYLTYKLLKKVVNYVYELQAATGKLFDKSVDYIGFIEKLVVFYLENSGHKITLYTKRWFALANHFFLCYNIFRYFSIFGGFLLTLNQYLL